LDSIPECSYKGSSCLQASSSFVKFPTFPLHLLELVLRQASVGDYSVLLGRRLRHTEKQLDTKSTLRDRHTRNTNSHKGLGLAVIVYSIHTSTKTLAIPDKERASKAWTGSQTMSEHFLSLSRYLLGLLMVSSHWFGQDGWVDGDGWGRQGVEERGKAFTSD
jgi:hypothetical protein